MGTQAGRLDQEEGQALLRLARARLNEHFEVGTAGKPGASPPPSPPPVFDAESTVPVSPRIHTEKRGVFVTLKRDGKLRGCVGYVEPIKALCDAVKDLAVSAAVRDGRFEPVEKAEVEDLDIEISVLTSPQALPQPPDPASIAIGRHGLVVRQGARSGLLLPQVAPEWGWSATEFLEHTCEKAGIPRDGWRDPSCKVLTFEAQVFDE